MSAPRENAVTRFRLSQWQMPPGYATRPEPATQMLVWPCDTRKPILDLTDRSSYEVAPTVDSIPGSSGRHWLVTRKGETAVSWTRPTTLSAVRAVEAYAQDGVFARDGAKPLDQRIVDGQTVYVPARDWWASARPQAPPIDYRTMTPATMFPYRDVPRVVAEIW